MSTPLKFEVEISKVGGIIGYTLTSNGNYHDNTGRPQIREAHSGLEAREVTAPGRQPRLSMSMRLWGDTKHKMEKPDQRGNKVLRLYG